MAWLLRHHVSGQSSAEVIKIENPRDGGDMARAVARIFGPEDSQFFHSFNVNKKSLTLDLTQDAGRAIFTNW